MHALVSAATYLDATALNLSKEKAAPPLLLMHNLAAVETDALLPAVDPACLRRMERNVLYPSSHPVLLAEAPIATALARLNMMPWFLPSWMSKGPLKKSTASNYHLKKISFAKQTNQTKLI